MSTVTVDLEQFRRETRAWLEKVCPPSQRAAFANNEDGYWGGRNQGPVDPELKSYFQAMADRGWTVPTWPKEYGGGGLSKEENKILEEEMRALNCRIPLKSFGIWMLGPVLLQYGSEELKREHLPKIAKGQIRWCQGYSEPGAGSDLASLQTKAVRDGDHFVVNGQKIWTSQADKSDWIFCLVRTGTDGGKAKQDGISFLLIDMASPGISVRPIKLISGSSPFCETFFEDVKVPVTNVVGKIDAGWTVAKSLLQHERSLISGGTGEKFPDLAELARKYLGVENGKLSEYALRDKIAQLEMDQLAFNQTMRRSAENMKAGHGVGQETSIFKLYATELKKRRRELMINVIGFQGLGWEGEGFTAEELDWTREWLRSRANSIEGGSSEIQLNIIAKRVLGLPD